MTQMLNTKTVVRDRKAPPTPLGWAVRALTIAFLAFVIFLLAREALREPVPPTIVAVAEWKEMQEGASRDTVVPVRIRNVGSAPAANIVIVIDRSGQDAAELNVPLLGAGDDVTFRIAFASRPSRLTYDVRSLQSF